MKKPVFLLVALVSFGFFFFYAHAGVEEWNRGDAAAAVLAETYTGETKGQKVSQKSYHDFRATRYRAEFVYEVNGKTYHTQTDTGIEPWAEEECTTIQLILRSATSGSIPSKKTTAVPTSA